MVRCEGTIYARRFMIVEIEAEVTEAGDLHEVGTWAPGEVREESLWCDECGQLGSDEYEDHGINDEWEWT